jgi:uncharacterized protein (TIRG00374 family)
MTPAVRSAWRWSLRFLLTATALILVFENLDLTRIGNLLQSASWIWIGGAALAIAVEFAMASWKTAWLLGSRTNVRRQFLANTAKLFVNQVMPGGFGGEAARMMWISREAGGLGRAAAAILLDRLSGFYTQLSATLLSLAVILGAASAVTMRVLAVGAFLALIGTFVLPFFLRRFLPAMARWSRRWIKTEFPDTGKEAEEFEAAWKETLLSPRRLTRLLLFSLSLHGGMMAWILCTGFALGSSISVWQASPILLLASLTTLAPLTVGNIGVTEGAYALGFAFFGFPPENGVAASLILRLLSLPPAALGAWLFARKLGGVALRASPGSISLK